MKRLIQGLAILLLVFTMFGCTKNTGPIIDPVVDPVVDPAADLKIGDTYQGGIVFYIFKEGDLGYDSKIIHGLIVSTEDQGKARWCLEQNQNEYVSGTLASIGSGSSNTDKITVQNGLGGLYAAGIARAYQGGGYSDWYLPSKDELVELYNAIQIIGDASFAPSYWSSTDYESGNAWLQNFSWGSQENSVKFHNSSIRAIRTF